MKKLKEFNKALYLVLGLAIYSSIAIEGQEADDYLIQVFKEHKGKVNAVAFSKSGKYLASGGEDKILVLRNLSNKENFVYSDNYFPVKDIEFFGDVQLFISAGKDIKLIDLQNNSLAIYQGNSTHIWSLDYAPERNKLTTGSYDTKIKVWDVRTEKIDLFLEGHEKSALAVAFSADERFIASGSRDKTIKVWNANSGELIHSLERHSGNIYDIQFHPNTKYFASASADKTIRLWDIEQGEVVKTYAGHDGSILDIEFSPDGYFMYSAGVDGTVYIWEVASGKKLYSYVDHVGSVNSIACSNDRYYIATAGNDGQVMLWKSAMNIVVDLYFRDEFLAAKEEDSVFLPKYKGESKSEYLDRLKEAEVVEKKLIEAFFVKYEEKIRRKNIP